VFYEIDNDKPRRTEAAAIKPGRRFAAFATPEEAQTILARFVLPARLMDNALNSRAMIYESHEGFDFVCVNSLTHKTPTNPPGKVCVYVAKDLLLFTGRHVESVHAMLADVLEDGNATLSLERLLLMFLERLIGGDPTALEDIEQEITELENALLTQGKRNAVREIISLRQRLMAYKRHYEQLLSVLDMLEGNDDNLLSPHAERTLRILSSRTDRLYHAVLNMRDYVTQVRESYQAEVDISLNNVMKIFTVITAIFLPLTLIVGWYGMNLKMPEFRWDFGYPMVIILSVAVVVFCLVMFKKKKWF
jgi:magnesium transporter